MKRKALKITAVSVLAAALVLPCVFVAAKPSNYTYSYDPWGDFVGSPDAYRVAGYYTGGALGAGDFREPQGLFISGEDIYVCDSGNNRVVHLRPVAGGGYGTAEIISELTVDGKPSALKYPTDAFQTEDGELFIADRGGGRVLRLNAEKDVLAVITKPTDETFDPRSDFLPSNIVVDKAGRLFVQAQNVNKGLMEFDADGTFVGYIGASAVTYNIADLLWKRFATQAQRKAMTLFIPTEYNNLALDNEGFIYVTNAAGGDVDPIRRLNTSGSDILTRNGWFKPIGDVEYSDDAERSGGAPGASKFIDVVPLENDSYACFDRTRGRIFVYDFQGYLLYAFGGLGNREGYFRLPAALDNMGSSLFALDAQTGVLTKFELTEYGAMIADALSEYRSGRYELSGEKWEEVLRYNGNYEPAFIGIARAALRQREYAKAMEYYKLGYMQEGYGKAYKLWRKEWFEANLPLVMLALAVIVIVPPTVRTGKRIWTEAKNA